MTARSEAPPTRYTQSESMRQYVLELVRETPGITGSELARLIAGNPCTINSRLAVMCQTGEMKRKPVVITQRNVRGHVRKVKTYAYTALVAKTISAETVRRMAENERKPSKPREKAEARSGGKTITPGRYVQKGGKWAANPGSGGQGAVERMVVIGSTLA